MTLYLTECEQRIIDLLHNATEYLWVTAEDHHKTNITAAPVFISLGTYDAPGTWHAADIVQQDGPVWKVKAALLIGGTVTYPEGTYWAWMRVEIPPETIHQRLTNMLVTVTGTSPFGPYGFGLYGFGPYGG
jgi:hypothetical protein